MEIIIYKLSGLKHVSGICSIKLELKESVHLASLDGDMLKPVLALYKHAQLQKVVVLG